MHIAILGAGNTGQIMAFDLAAKGARVRLWGRNPEVVGHIARHGITAEGKLTGAVTLDRATTDMGEAVAGAEAIFIMTTAGGHRPVAEALKPHLQAGQLCIVFNANWGALECMQVFQAAPAAPPVLVGETGTQLYIGAATAPGKVFAKQIKEKITLAMGDPARTDDVIERLKPLFPQFTRAANVLETSLSSANAVVHTPVCLFNLARIDLGHDFLFYSEGASRTTVAYVEAVDRERMAVMEALGLPARTMLEILNSFWPDKRATLYEAIHENASYRQVKGPKSLNHRFLTEDIPYGVVPQAHLGKCLNVPTPYTDAMLAAFEQYMGKALTAAGFRPDVAELVRVKG